MKLNLYFRSHFQKATFLMMQRYQIFLSFGIYRQFMKFYLRVKKKTIKLAKQECVLFYLKYQFLKLCLQKLKQMSIFSEIQNQSSSSLPSYLPKYKTTFQYSSSESQNKYIDQFLQKDAYISLQQNPEISKKDQNDFQYLGQPSETQKVKEPRQKSVFHNFQKHLIITLRKSVQIPKDIVQKRNKALGELWKAFCEKKSYNKSLLQILFGQKMMQEDLNKKLFRKEGFKNIYDKFLEDEIIEAQHTLRRIVYDQLDQSNVDKILETRKLPEKTKELFKKYISEFIQELKEGQVMKRLPKSKKRKMFSPQ